MKMIKLLIVVQKRQTYLGIFLFHIWTAVLMSCDEVELFSIPLVTKQDACFTTCIRNQPFKVSQFIYLTPKN